MTTLLNSINPRLGAMIAGRQLLYAASNEAKESNNNYTRLVALGTGMSSYLTACQFLNEDYALRVDGHGNERTAANTRALGNMLDFSRSRVLKRVRQLEDLDRKAIPESIVLNYVLAESLRNGGPADQLAALSAYWRACSLCDLAYGISKNNQTN